MTERDDRLIAMGATRERKRLAGLLAAEPASEEISYAATVLGIGDELDAAWDALHPEDAGKPRGHGQRLRFG